MSFYKDKKILVTGGTGLIGASLVTKLLDSNAEVRVASLDDGGLCNPLADFMKVDLTKPENCKKACLGMDYVFHVAGIKGNPKVAANNPASFFDSTILFNTNMLRAAHECDVDRYLFTSTVGVYAPAEVMNENDVWKSFPSENDKFAGWAKRMGELQTEAYKIQYGWNKISIVRPGNVYGPGDNFSSVNSTAMASLIRRAVDGENPLKVWGDGSQVRDFVYVDDVADAMMLVMEKEYNNPVNIGSGIGNTIKEVVDIISEKINPIPGILYDTSKPSGDKKRVLNIERLNSLGWNPKISLSEGIERTIKSYKNKGDQSRKLYNVFI